MSVPKTGSVSSVGPNGAAPAPRGLKNTRDYGKKPPAAPAPMGPMSSPSPFGITDGGSRLGGI
jgi:hypothetical protein